MKRFITLLSLALTFSAYSIPHYVGQARTSNLGAELRYFGPVGSKGVLFGWRFEHSPSKRFSMGGAGYTGQLSGTSNGTFSYGGLTSTLHLWLSDFVATELSLLAGGGGGYSGIDFAGGILIDTQLGLKMVLGPSVAATLNAGYLWMPSVTQFSGMCAGMRFAFTLEQPTPPLPPAHNPQAPTAPPTPPPASN